LNTLRVDLNDGVWRVTTTSFREPHPDFLCEPDSATTDTTMGLCSLVFIDGPARFSRAAGEALRDLGRDRAWPLSTEARAMEVLLPDAAVLMDDVHEMKGISGCVQGGTRQRPCRCCRTQDRSANPDMNNVRDGFVRCPHPLMISQSLDHVRQLVQAFADDGRDVLAIDVERWAIGITQGDVQGRAVFSTVDGIACEHPVPPLFDTCGAGKLDQGVEGSTVQVVF